MRNRFELPDPVMGSSSLWLTILMKICLMLASSAEDMIESVAITSSRLTSWKNLKGENMGKCRNSELFCLPCSKDFFFESFLLDHKTFKSQHFHRHRGVKVEQIGEPFMHRILLSDLGNNITGNNSKHSNIILILLLIRQVPGRVSLCIWHKFPWFVLSRSPSKKYPKYHKPLESF